MSAAQRLAQLGLTLPTPTAPAGSYATAVRTGNLLFLAGHICRRNGTVVSGKVGHTGTHDRVQANQLARLCALELLATIDATVGLDHVRKVVKLAGFVNSMPDFSEHPAVIDGASDLLVQVFGEEIGRHARSAVGAAALPLDAAVEIEAIVELV